MCSGLKKIISLILTVIIAMTASVSVFAAQDFSADYTSAEFFDEEYGSYAEDEIVARASLFAAMYVFPVSGHTWIYVENLSDDPINVGLYEVPVGEGVSVGAFSFSVNDGWGIYYNLEAYRENRDDNVGNCRSLTVELTQSELEKLSESIRNYPNMWDIFIFNCTFFAFAIWNHNTDYFFIPMMIPALAMLEVMIMGAEKGVTTMYYPTSDQVFKQRGTGDSAYLEPVGEKTLSR